MSMTSKYAPKSYRDIVGNVDKVTKLEGYIEQGDVNALLVGPPGVGKTSSVYMLGKKMGKKIIEQNASDSRKKDDLLEMKRRVKTKSLRDIIYLFEEIDGMNRSYQFRILSEILDNASDVVVLTANKRWELPDKIKDRCKVLEYDKPKKKEILKRMKEIAKKEGIEDVDYSKITRDVRDSINALFYDAEGYEEKNIFDKVRKVFGGKEVEIDDLENLLYWLMDNAPNFYNGIELYKVYKILSLADNTDNPDVLKMLPKGKGKVKYPTFFRKRKNSWRRG